MKAEHWQKQTQSLCYGSVFTVYIIETVFQRIFQGFTSSSFTHICEWKSLINHCCGCSFCSLRVSQHITTASRFKNVKSYYHISPSNWLRVQLSTINPLWGQQAFPTVLYIYRATLCFCRNLSTCILDISFAIQWLSISLCFLATHHELQVHRFNSFSISCSWLACESTRKHSEHLLTLLVQLS